MSNEVLLETLVEALRALELKKGEVEVRQIQCQRDKDWYQEQTEQAEEQERWANKENGEIVEKMEALRMHIASQQNPPAVLNDKFTELQSQQMQAMRKVRSAMDHATNMRSTLKRSQMDVATTAQELAAVRSDWHKISEQVASITKISTK